MYAHLLHAIRIQISFKVVNQGGAKTLFPAEVLPTRQFKLVEEKTRAGYVRFSLRGARLKECAKIFQKVLRPVFRTTIMLNMDAYSGFGSTSAMNSTYYLIRP